MKSKRTLLLSLLMVLSLGAGCDLVTEIVNPNDDYVLRAFGEVCKSHAECASSFCIEYGQGAFCTQLCTEGCPEGWECKLVDNPHSSGTQVSLCAMQRHRLCVACSSDMACSLDGSDWCLAQSSGQYCARDCSYSGCPVGYVCSDVEREGVAGRQCLPESGACECNAESEGLVRGCEVTNEFGTCHGTEMCAGEILGWQNCDALFAQAEVCNGRDDDCDGFVDEDTDGGVCENTNAFGSCLGEELCKGVDGLVCDGPFATQELCNGVDDNCNGDVDETFLTKGLYAMKEHCGACGQNCDEVMAHSVSTECVVEDGAAQCRALACEPGFFPYLNGLVCMALPSNLCMACTQDSDCIGPKSLCVSTGLESFCGRSCDSDSAYGQGCPEGYVCGEYKGTKQCLPATGTCLCNKNNVDIARTCNVESCVGFEWCKFSGEDYTWSSCEIDAYNIEICDGLDNNCDGRIDEGILNQTTGLYDSSEHCGYCFNDCSTYFKPEIHHVTGACLTTSGKPQCGMGACLKDTLQGKDYEWVDTDGLSENGCECHRVLGNTSYDEPDLVPGYDAGFQYIDENCDGVDGVVTDAIFVRQGSSAGDGSLNKPFGTLQEALEAWSKVGKRYILVSEGIYYEDLIIPEGVVIHGGYSKNFHSRDVVAHASTIQGVSALATLTMKNIHSKTLLSGLVIKGADRHDLSKGQPSVAIWIVNSTDALTLRSLRILGGVGETGTLGTSGLNGYGRQDDASLNGGSGLDSERFEGPCDIMFHAGGFAGRNEKCTQANGMLGGRAICPSYNWATHMGNRAQYDSTKNNNGLGGYDETFDEKSSYSCTHATETGFPVNIRPNGGEDARSGADGASGMGGEGGRERYGTIEGLFWAVSTRRARAGNTGLAGEPGGGGGAGGGTAYYPDGGCTLYELGPSGGGGGAGGCGGQGGLYGGQGGASIGILLTSAAPTSIYPNILYNTFQRGLGGTGGAGGAGGQGGAGGIGGTGGIGSYWIATKAGRGGDGGTGGRGGGGGGGAGGPSFDIATYNLHASKLLEQNTFVYDDSVPTGGIGGNGGISDGISASGKPGVQGASARLHAFTACNQDSDCPSGACDKNNICVFY